MSAPRHLWSENWREESAAAAEELAEHRAQAAGGAEELAERRAQAAGGAARAAPEPVHVSRPRPPRLDLSRMRPRLDLSRLRLGLRRLRAALFGWLLAGVRQLRAVPRRLRLSRRRLRAALLVALVTVLGAGAGYAAVSMLTGSSGASSTFASERPPWLGIEMASSTFGANSGLTVGGFSGGFPVATGVFITEVVPGSPAAAAGLQPGDVLTQVSNRPVASPADVQAAIAGLRAGDSATLEYQLGAMTYTTRATLAARPAGYP